MDLLDDLDPAQRAAVTSQAAPLAILAAAGSGKTRVLTRRIAYRVRTQEAEADHVLAVTFTRKAAGELRSRLAALGVEGVTVGTFHALAWAQLRRRALDDGRWAPAILRDKTRLVPRDVATRIERAKAQGIGPTGDPDYERYEADKQRLGLLDFDDLLLRCAEAIEADPAFAKALRWRFRHFFVDEYQDVNPLQFRLLRAWLGDRLDLTVVGDPNQSVYGWNGADPTLLARFPEHFPTAEAVRLDTNYRSTGAIVTVAASVLPETTGGAGPPRPPRHADRPGASLPTVRRHDTAPLEAHDVARQVRLAHAPGTPWSDIAVLVRTNAQLRPLEAALRARGIPHASPGNAWLRTPEAKAELRALVDTPPAVPFRSAVKDLTVEPLVELAAEYQRFDRSPSGPGFVSWLHAVVRPHDRDGHANAVTLATFHGAKGLEWPTVFVAGVEDGLVPVAGGDDEEERRLLYVALSRAVTTLHCSWAAERNGRLRSPSPWLADIEAAVAAVAAAAAPFRARRCSPRPEGDRVLDALQRWRANQARAARVPAAAVVPDAVLAAVAEARPTTSAELQAMLGPLKAAAFGPSLLDVVARAGS
ncbi:MAG TPA: UvrD-helicase domain-containing protein [Acidimicrobiales bacterium]|nr:UvrD-helicase domain-containing protein [Acidimicrobiales bacterium]